MKTETGNNKMRAFLKNSIYTIPYGIRVKEANSMLATFTFSRHPFERLVSAYGNSLRQGKVLEEALTQYNSMAHSKPKDYLTPMEFVQYCIELAHESGPVYFNPHIKPQYAVCPFCALEFDYVGDVQNLSKDIEFISGILGFKVNCGILFTFGFCYITYIYA